MLGGILEVTYQGTILQTSYCIFKLLACTPPPQFACRRDYLVINYLFMLSLLRVIILQCQCTAFQVGPHFAFYNIYNNNSMIKVLQSHTI